LQRVIDEMSTWEADSLISRFNRAPAGSWHALPEDFFTVLDAALAMATDSAGAFDPTVGPLVDLWGFGAGSVPRDALRLPDPALLAVAPALWLAAHRLTGQGARCSRPGVSSGFFGIAKDTRWTWSRRRCASAAA
jgi:thiamine biosynthesis lipoprotein